jgi:flagellar export protein FliJ
MAFEFELQTVLEHRERLERARQAEVAAIEAQRMAVESDVRAIQDQMAAGRRELRTQLSGQGPGQASVAIGAVRLAANSSLHDLIRLQRAAIELAGVHQKLSRARQALLKASIQRKAVQTLRDRRYNDYRKRLARREADELDDLMVMRGGPAHSENQS